MLKWAVNFTFGALSLPKLYAKMTGGDSETIAFSLRISSRKECRWIVLDLCWDMLSILRSVLHPSPSYKATKFRYEPPTPTFESKMVLMNCAEMCRKFYVSCFTRLGWKQCRLIMLDLFSIMLLLFHFVLNLLLDYESPKCSCYALSWKCQLILINNNEWKMF